MLRTMLDQVAQGIAMFNAAHRLVGWNDQLRQLLDLSVALLDGAPKFEDFIGFLAARGDFGPPSASVDAAIRDLTAALHEPRVDERMLPDGRILESRRNPLPDGGLTLVYTDVSERRHADYLVRDSERRLRTILDKAPVAIAVVGQEDGEIKQVNARFRKLFGVDGAEILEPVDISRYVTAEDRARILDARAGEHTEFESSVRRADGTNFWASVSSIRFVFEWAPAVLTSFHDVSARRLAEAELREEIERKQAELGEARVLQLELTPSPLEWATGRHDVRVDVVLEPAKEVGGDLVDFFRIDENLLVLALGDVSHKGAGAALFMARAHSLIRGIAARPDAGALFREPANAIGVVNAALSRNNATCMFVTMLLATFDAETGRLTYVRAGHLPPLLRRASGAVERLHGHGGPPLGLAEQAVHKSAIVDVHPGDQILTVTDGITEATDPSGALFGEARLEAFFQTATAADRDILKRLTAEVRRFEAGRPPSDDVAAILLALQI